MDWLCGEAGIGTLCSLCSCDPSAGWYVLIGMASLSLDWYELRVSKDPSKWTEQYGNSQSKKIHLSFHSHMYGLKIIGISIPTHNLRFLSFFYLLDLKNVTQLVKLVRITVYSSHPIESVSRLIKLSIMVSVSILWFRARCPSIPLSVH